MVESVASIRRDRVNRRTRGKFFAFAATAMLLIVFVAFSRTFYFRAFVEDTDRTAILGQQSLPWHVLVHGLVLSLWFVIFCAQTWLVASKRIPWHRKLGVLGVGVSAAVCPSGVSTFILFIPRGLEGGFPIEGVTSIAVGTTLFLLLFVASVSLAVIWRHRPDVHKRDVLCCPFDYGARLLVRESTSFRRVVGERSSSGGRYVSGGHIVRCSGHRSLRYTTTSRVHVTTMVLGVLFPLCESLVSAPARPAGVKRTPHGWDNRDRDTVYSLIDRDHAVSVEFVRRRKK